jgi:hypothetical protein
MSRLEKIVMFSSAAALLVACGGTQPAAPRTAPSFTIPLDPTPPPEENEAQPELAAGAAKAPPEYAPDPEPLRTADQFECSFRYEKGEVKLVGATKRTMPQPVSTPRRLGRFAVELWLGHELIERVRFDFPLLAAPPEQPEKDKKAPSIESGLVVTQKLLVPTNDRATRAVLVDRATGEQRELPWPLTGNPETVAPLPAPAAPSPGEAASGGEATGAQTSASSASPGAAPGAGAAAPAKPPPSTPASPAAGTSAPKVR